MKKIKARKRHKNKLRFLQIVVLLLISFLGLKNIRFVNAGTSDSKLEKNRVDGVYAVAFVGGKQHLYYLNMYRMNGRVAYCIEIGVDIITDIYHSTTDFTVVSLTEEQRRYIQALSYVGYLYQGNIDYRYYMATQELIWEYLSNYTLDVEWTNVLDVNGERINIDGFKKEVSEVANEYLEEIHFNWVDGDIYDMGEELFIKDTSFTLMKYDIVSSGHSSAWIEGNVLHIRVSDHYVGMDKIVLRKREYYSYDSMFYYFDSSQKLVSSGNFDAMEKEIYYRIRGATLNVQVVDKETGLSIPSGQASLKGSVYELYNDRKEFIGTYESEEDGNFYIDNLPYGTYFIRQIKASEGYLIQKEDVWFEFLEDGMQLDLTEEVISNQIEIRKVYGNKENGYREEAGISFSVENEFGNFYDIVVTDKNGVASLRLPYGKYIVHQEDTTYGYSKVDDFIISVTDVEERVLHYELMNHLIQCLVEVITLDKESGEKILVGGGRYKIRAKGSDEYLEEDGEDVFLVDENGKFLFPLLIPYGDYEIEQVGAPDGYVLNHEVIRVTLGPQTKFSVVNGQLVAEVVVYNRLIKGQIDLLASEEVFYRSENDYGYDKKEREGRDFSLLADDDIFVQERLLYSKGEVIKEIKTDTKGRSVIENLYLGKYCLVDQELEKQECFTLESSSGEDEIVEERIEFIKLLDKGNVVVKNVSESEDVISGTVFEIYDKDDIMIYTGISNEEGIVKVSNLLYGNYCILQKSISKDYQLNQEKQCILVDGNKEMKYVNRKAKKKLIMVPNTFSNKESLGKLCFMIVIGIGVLFYKKIGSS